MRAQQTFTTFQAANVVVGQADFTSQNPIASQTVTGGPTSAAVSATGQMAIGDDKGHRVLIWNSIPTTNGAPADVVVGQPDFNSTNFGTSATSMRFPEGVAFSPDGSKLLVCDRANNRVLIWNTVPTTNGQPADVVVGQTDFVSSAPGLSGSRLNGPAGVLVTPDGIMVITDYLNNRVLIFNSIPTTNGVSADAVIGQFNVTTNIAGTGKTGLFQPWSSAYSGDGKLVVADQGNNRVLVYNSLSEATTVGADVVIGQTNFVQDSDGTSDGTSDDTLQFPRGVAVSGDGQLAIGDLGNNRVLIYNTIPTSNGAPADVVLGQADFNSGLEFSGGISAQSMDTVYQLAYAPNGRLLVSGGDMRRVMIFGNTNALPAVLTLPATLVVPTGALLNGLVNPDGINTDIRFEYSTDPGLAGAISTTSQNIGSGSVELPVNASVMGLLPKTTYYFRVVATNIFGTFPGNILSFYTGVLNWGGTGTDASDGALDASLIPTNGTQTFTNVNGQGYYIVVTTSNLGADGQGSYFGAPDWWFQGSAPGGGYSTVTFQFFDSLTNQPYALSGVDFRLLDAEIDERFRDFGYWDANDNFVAVSNTSSLLTFVFLNVQSQAFFPSYGGLGLNPVGTYGGTLTPSTAGAGAAGTSGNVSAASSIGLFSIGVPQIGLATGTFALFIQGGAYVGDFIGSVDPTSETLSGILSGKSTFTIAVPFAVTAGNPPVTTITFSDQTIGASGNMEAVFSQGSLTSGVGNTTLLTGTCTIIAFLNVDANGAPVPTATQTFLVNGTLQATGTVQPTTITLINSGSSSGSSSSGG